LNDESIREVKYSDKLKEADRIQVLYYLYFLKQLGIIKKGIINYPKMKKREEVVLTLEAEKEVESALIRIREILSRPNPPKLVRKPYCTKCSYFQFCWG
jgi:CRISPR-associated exonuclease Cas4